MAKLRLDEVLKRKGISHRKFVRMLGTDSGTAGRYFRPGYNPTLATLEKWAKVLNVKIRDLIKE